MLSGSSNLVDTILTVLIDLVKAEINNEELSLSSQLGKVVDKVSSDILKFVGTALTGIGEGLKKSGPTIKNIGLLISLFGVGPGAGMAIALPGGGTIAEGGILLLGIGTTAIGVTAEQFGKVLAFVGKGISEAGNKSRKQDKEEDGASEHMLGENGTQIGGSKTTGQNGPTERVDVENPAPG